MFDRTDLAHTGGELLGVGAERYQIRISMAAARVA